MPLSRDTCCRETNFFVHQWAKNNRRPWVLLTLKKGLKLEFLSIPFLSGIRETSVNAHNLPILLQMEEKILEKNATEPVLRQEIQKGLYSTFLLDSKILGELRPVINLCP